jgi:hypothetical protein
LEYILDVCRETVLERMANETNHDDLCRYQGAARQFVALKIELAKQVKVKDERAADKSPNGRT